MFFKTSLSRNLYNRFTSNYQTFTPESTQDEISPYVYVGSDGEMKLITLSQDINGSQDRIFAQGVSNDGWVEYLEVNEGQ